MLAYILICSLLRGFLDGMCGDLRYDFFTCRVSRCITFGDVRLLDFRVEIRSANVQQLEHTGQQVLGVEPDYTVCEQLVGQFDNNFVLVFKRIFRLAKFVFVPSKDETYESV